MPNEMRERRAKYNIITSLISQLVAVVCGLIVPNILLTHFGSEIYGATASITQFLSYIALLEGGIGGVARAALYKPLADNDSLAVSSIIGEVTRFFKIVAIVFFVYSIVVAASFKPVTDIKSLDYISTFLLVLAISVSSLIQYYFGIPNAILINADQKVYINSLLTSITFLLNAVSVIVLVKANANIIVVKLFSSIVFGLRPIALYIYVKKHYKVIYTNNKTNYLSQKWTGLGQHIAFFLHTNTDIVILTLFTNLKLVAVYSVYNMIVANIRNIVFSFTSGMEALFGDMYAKGEKEMLNRVFSSYETMISVISVSLFSTTMALIVPFIRIYTKAVSDENYVAIGFAFTLIMAELVYCLREPYHCIAVSANRFKETKLAAYGEAIINICLSVILVFNYGLLGVALATLIAMSFRYIYYAVYLSKHIIRRSLALFFRRLLVNTTILIMNSFLDTVILRPFVINTYKIWFFTAVIIFSINALVTISLNYLFYKEDTVWVINKIRKRIN